jgi:hypothetical protein
VGKGRIGFTNYYYDFNAATGEYFQANVIYETPAFESITSSIRGINQGTGIRVIKINNGYVTPNSQILVTIKSARRLRYSIIEQEDGYFTLRLNYYESGNTGTAIYSLVMN